MTPMQAPATTTANGGCGCGCGCDDCQQGACCRLECLVRPNFYCGQLLTDRDLTAIVDWVQAKASLRRYRDDWGVVCGLEVTCAVDAQGRRGLSVSRGYAIDCCGRDIVVCEPLTYTFTCGRTNDPCCRGAGSPTRGTGTTSGTVLRSFQPGGTAAKTDGGSTVTITKEPTNPDQRTIGCLPREQLRAYALCLQYDETMTAGQRALVRGNCSARGDCQFTRVIEGGKLVATEIADPWALVKTSSDDATYQKQLSDFIAALTKHSDSSKDLLAYIQGKLHTFCYVEDCLCKMVAGGKDDPNALKQLVADIIFDFRLHLLRKRCESCVDDPCDGDGVPLARVWVWDRRDPGCVSCNVVFIEARSPYRKPIGCPCDSRLVSAGFQIMQPVADVVQELQQKGISATDAPIPDGADPATAVNTSTELTQLTPGAKVVLHTRPDLNGVPRVVAITQG